MRIAESSSPSSTSAMHTVSLRFFPLRRTASPLKIANYNSNSMNNGTHRTGNVKPRGCPMLALMTIYLRDTRRGSSRERGKIHKSCWLSIPLCTSLNRMGKQAPEKIWSEHYNCYFVQPRVPSYVCPCENLQWKGTKASINNRKACSEQSCCRNRHPF